MRKILKNLPRELRNPPGRERRWSQGRLQCHARSIMAEHGRRLETLAQ